KRYNIAVLVFDGVDVLDFTGPIEIFSHVTLNKNPHNPDRVYKITTISRGSTIRAANSLTVQWTSQSKMPCASYSNSIFSWSQELLLRSSRPDYLPKV
ncbi:hypothetical protein L207DRAFT_622069, partial [Hyaloscypha variabilis F]